MVNTSKIKLGDLLSFTDFGVVTRVCRNGENIVIKNVDTGHQIEIEGKDLVETANSADEFIGTKHCTKTQLVDAFLSVGNLPFTVCFDTKTTTNRVLRGRILGCTEKNMGYVDVEDLDKPEGDRYRKVDTRTLHWLIVDGVKYTVK